MHHGKTSSASRVAELYTPSDPRIHQESDSKSTKGVPALVIAICRKLQVAHKRNRLSLKNKSPFQL